MKKILFPLSLLALFACSPKVVPVVETAPPQPQLNTFLDSMSYIQGAMIAKQLLSEEMAPTELQMDERLLRMGIEEASKQDTWVNDEIAQQYYARYQTKLKKAKEEKTKADEERNKVEGENFLKENALKEGVMTTASGLQYKVLQEGTGATPSAGDRVEVHYEGRLIDGTVFDSSYKRGSTTTFGVTQVIRGWTEGLQLMKEGAKYQFYIPSALAYGNRGAGAKIGPGATLIFDVELIKVIQ